MKQFAVTLLTIFSTFFASAQNDDRVLLTINDQPISAQEFKRVYQKNLELVEDEDQKSVDGYLNLFIDYKLKVAEAKAQGLDTVDSYLKDFKKYEEQLSRNYIYEDNITADLAEEAYARGLEEVKVSHILIKVGWDDFPQDTLVAYNKMAEVRKKALAGEDFAALARKYSEEPGADQRGGALGYFSVFDMVYPFESMAYNTPVGQVSDIVRTQFGYHILKVHDRRAKLPEVTVSHIMISTRDDSTGTKSKERIQEIYALIQQGESFEDLAKQYSDDKNTGRMGGKMRPFTKGQLKAPPFEEAAYKLEKAGDISEPIQTRFGWHIIRLEKKHDIPTFAEEKTQLERKIKEGARGKVVTSAINDKIKHRFGFKDYPYQDFFLEKLTDSIFSKSWKYESVSGAENKKLFTIGDSTYYYNDLGRYMENRQAQLRPYRQKRAYLGVAYEQFETTKVKDYFRRNLEQENDDYASVIQEYRDGLLIFDVMEKNVWMKAKKDTVGQMGYYNQHIDRYQWKDRVDGAIFQSTDKSNLDLVMALIKEGKTPSEVKATLNTPNKVAVMVTEGVFENGSDKLPKNYVPMAGFSKIFDQEGTFTLVYGKTALKGGPKPFEKVQGRVLSDYQTALEEQWMAQLRKKFAVDINKKTLKKLKKELRS